MEEMKLEEMKREETKPLRFTRLDLITMVLAAESECEQLRVEMEELRPKAAFYDLVADGSDTFSLGETAKMLSMPGMGRNKLIGLLRRAGVLMSNNVAKQRYVDRGYFQVVQDGYAVVDGQTRLRAVTRVRPKGIDYIRRLLNS